jgi:nitrate reductase NapAB chaperone NapD
LGKEWKIIVVLRSHNLDKLVESGISEDLELLADVLYMKLIFLSLITMLH